MYINKRGGKKVLAIEIELIMAVREIERLREQDSTRIKSRIGIFNLEELRGKFRSL